MDITFDTATGQLSIDRSDAKPFGADLRARLNRHGQTINLRGVEMHLSVTADGETVFDMHLPPPGVRYSKTNQDTLATGRVTWQPDQAITVNAWCKTNAGQTVTAEAQFTAPRPPQPYPSWEWTGTHWTAPVERPEGEGWQWDEAGQRWVLNINTADAATLQRLDGVGPVRADLIIGLRASLPGGRFEAVEQLTQVSGIGDDDVARWQADPGLEV